MGRRSIATLVLVMTVLAACSAPPSEAPAQNRIIYGLTLQVSGIDPHINQSSELGIVLRQVYDTLVYRDPTTREFVPGLAESWTISEDGLLYTFNLRQDVAFHDGTPMNAESVRLNFDRIVYPDTLSQKARSLLGPIVAYRVPNDYTFEIELNRPYAPLLDGLAQVYLGIASPSALATVNALPGMEEYNTLLYQYHQVGTGPYRFVEYIPGDRIVIERNTDYTWGPSFYTPPEEDTIDVIEYRFFDDAATRSVALESGEADIMGELLPADGSSLSNNAEVQLEPVAIPGQPLQFYMNTTVAPTDNLAVRQALLYATDREAIVESIFQGFSPVAWGPISASSLYYNSGVQGVYDYNPAQAIALLSSAGYADSDDDDMLDLNGDPLIIRIVQPPWSQLPEVAQLLRDQWAAVGIQAVIEPVPGFAGLMDKIGEAEYNLVAFSSYGLQPSYLIDSFMSTSEQNWTGYADPNLDTALANAISTQDEDDRSFQYGTAQAIIMQQALILPIRDTVNLNAHRSTIRGLSFDAYGWFPLMVNASVVAEEQ
ncbi:MAG: hypothetical protein CL607_07780 [Anaerolineaceae bacterium]|nr:hypothetical protein [Anaerolineaceae bacterium]